MANYKRRKRRKGGIKGCGLCKPHKTCAARGCYNSQTRQEQKARLSEKEQTREPC